MGIDDDGMRFFFPLTTTTKKDAYCRKAKKQRLIDEEDERDRTRRPMPRESAKTEEQREEEEASVFVFIFVYINQLYFSPMLRVGNITKSKPKIKIKQFAMTPMIVDNEKLERDRTCGFVGYCLGTFPRSTVLISWYWSFHSIRSEATNKWTTTRSIPSKIFYGIDRLLPVGHVEPTFNRSTLTIAC